MLLRDWIGQEWAVSILGLIAYACFMIGLIKVVKAAKER